MSDPERESVAYSPRESEWVVLSETTTLDGGRFKSGKNLWLQGIPAGLESVEAPAILLDTVATAGLSVKADDLYVLQGDWRTLSGSSKWERLTACGPVAERKPGGVDTLWPEVRVDRPAAERICTETMGFSIWHMIALQVFDIESIPRFFELAAKESPETLQHDLWEYTADSLQIESYIIGYEYTNELWELPWPVVRRLLQYRTPLELCLLMGAPFLGYAEEYLDAEVKWPEAAEELRRTSGWLLGKLQE